MLEKLNALNQRMWSEEWAEEHMKQKWEIVHWPNNKRVQLCESKEIAEKLLPYHGKSHIIREVWFYDDGTHYVRFNVE